MFVEVLWLNITRFVPVMVQLRMITVHLFVVSLRLLLMHGEFMTIVFMVGPVAMFILILRLEGNLMGSLMLERLSVVGVSLMLSIMMDNWLILVHILIVIHVSNWLLVDVMDRFLMTINALTMRLIIMRLLRLSVVITTAVVNFNPLLLLNRWRLFYMMRVIAAVPKGVMVSRLLLMVHDLVVPMAIILALVVCSVSWM